MPSERIRGWQLLWFLIENGWLPKASRCSVTGSTDRVSWHNENYYTPWQPYAVSAHTHRLLHQRFSNPNAWDELVKRNTETGEEWYAGLSNAPHDLAAALREQHGTGVVDVFAQAGLPKEVEVPLGEIYSG